jgi:hypothetical protein
MIDDQLELQLAKNKRRPARGRAPRWRIKYD